MLNYYYYFHHDRNTNLNWDFVSIKIWIQLMTWIELMTIIELGGVHFNFKGGYDFWKFLPFSRVGRLECELREMFETCNKVVSVWASA